MKKLLFFLLFTSSLYAQTPVNIKEINDQTFTGTGLPVNATLQAGGATVTVTNSTPSSLTTLSNIQTQQSGGFSALISADSSTAISISSPTSTQIIAASGTKAIHVTGFGITISVSAATPDNVSIVSGTGSNCATGQVTLFGPLTGGVQETLVSESAPVVFSYGGGLGQIFQTTASQAICVVTTGAQPIGGGISFAQFFYIPPQDSFEAIIPIWHSKRIK